MTKIILFFISAMAYFTCCSQNVEDSIHEKYFLLSGENNGLSLGIAIKNYGSIILFSYDQNLSQFENIRRKSNSKSYGEIRSFKSHVLSPDYPKIKGVTYTFIWDYYNSYDDKNGTASVKIVKHKKPQGTAIEVRIIPQETNDTLQYRGYEIGTLNLDVYDKKFEKLKEKL